MGEITTWGVKVPENFKTDLQDMITKSGMQSGDFLMHLTAIYEMELAKKDVPTISSDLDEVKKLTTRLLNAYIGMAQKINTFGEEKEREVNKVIGDKETEVLMLQAKISTAAVEEESLRGLISDTVAERDEALQRNNQLSENLKAHEETIGSQKDLISSYKEKIDSLSGIITEYEGYKNDYNNLSKTLQEREKELSDVNSQLKNLSAKIEHLGEERARIEQEHTREIARIKEQSEFDKKQVVLEEKIKHQSNIELMATKHQQDLEEVRKDDTAHMKSLYEQINKLQEKSEKKVTKKTEKGEVQAEDGK